MLYRQSTLKQMRPCPSMSLRIPLCTVSLRNWDFFSLCAEGNPLGSVVCVLISRYDSSETRSRFLSTLTIVADFGGVTLLRATLPSKSSVTEMPRTNANRNKKNRIELSWATLEHSHQDFTESTEKNTRGKNKRTVERKTTNRPEMKQQLAKIVSQDNCAQLKLAFNMEYYGLL